MTSIHSQKDRFAALLPLLTLSALAAPQIAFGWGDIGHGTVGEIAEQELTAKGKAFVYSIIGSEPLGVAAVWPDHVRSDTRFKDFAPYHFVEIPSEIPNYLLLNGDQQTLTDANAIITQAPALLTGRKLSIQQKMVLLRYLVHIVGDVHQPLHVGNGLDRGANLCSVQVLDPVSGKSHTSNLHSVWDDEIIGILAAQTKIKYFDYKNMADLVKANVTEPGTDYESVIKVPVDGWYQESRSYYSTVYPDTDPNIAPKDRPYCKAIDVKTQGILKGNFDESKIAVIDNAYIKKATPVIYKQLLIGGHRLAGMLNAMAEKAHHLRQLTKPNYDQDELTPLKLKNETRHPASIKHE